METQTQTPRPSPAGRADRGQPHFIDLPAADPAILPILQGLDAIGTHPSEALAREIRDCQAQIASKLALLEVAAAECAARHAWMAARAHGAPPAMRTLAGSVDSYSRAVENIRREYNDAADGGMAAISHAAQSQCRALVTASRLVAGAPKPRPFNPGWVLGIRKALDAASLPPAPFAATLPALMAAADELHAAGIAGDEHACTLIAARMAAPLFDVAVTYENKAARLKQQLAVPPPRDAASFSAAQAEREARTASQAALRQLNDAAAQARSLAESFISLADQAEQHANSIRHKSVQAQLKRVL